MSTTFYDGQGNAITIDSGGGGNVSEDVNHLLTFNDWPQYYGYISGAKWSYANPTGSGYGQYKFTLIPVNGGESIYINGWSNGKVSIVTSFSEPVQGADAPPLATGIPQYNMLFTPVNNLKTLPSDARYLIIQTRFSGTTDYWAPHTLIIDDTEYMINVRDEVTNLHYKNGVNWINFGDSITCGYYSYWVDKENDVATSTSTEFSFNWTSLVSKINNWKYIHDGNGGQGWINGGNPIYTHVKDQEIDYTKYNLVTFSVGINDWKGKWPYQFGSITDSYTYSDNLVPTTVVESMRFCFDYILRRNPEIKIIVISPFNCRGYGSHEVHPYGSYETSWARGFKRYNANSTGTDDFATIAASTKLRKDQTTDAVYAYVRGDIETFDTYVALATQAGGCNREEFIALAMWAYNRAKTLDEFTDIMQSVCDEYGIEMIDMTRYSVINRTNLPELLPDGVHPSLRCHRLLARELSKKLSFNLGGDTCMKTDYLGSLVIDVDSITLENEGDSTTVSVYLDTKPSTPVTVMISSSNTGKIRTTPGNHSYSPEGTYPYNKTQSFTVKALAPGDTGYVAGVVNNLKIYIAAPQSPNNLVITIPVTITNMTPAS